MNFNQHYNLQGKHAFMSASSNSWLNYDSHKLRLVYANNLKKQEGTKLHEFASEAIKLRIKLHPLKKALHMFVNDAIGFGMESEVVLYYSDNCFGTADAILFKDNVLRIHDLKTGVSKVNFKQLDVYTALFCLEYGVAPTDIEIEQRLYQGKDCMINVPDPNDILYVMDKIISFDMELEDLKLSLR